jgi:hypothetical protein
VSITAVPNLSLGYAGLVCFADLHRARSSGPAEFRERLRVSALVSLSGAAAEAEFTREPISGILRRCDGDRLDAHRTASTYALSLPRWDGDMSREVFADWLEETMGLVRQNWRTILALARALTLNGSLQACDVARVIAMADRAVA